MNDCRATNKKHFAVTMMLVIQLTGTMSQKLNMQYITPESTPEVMSNTSTETIGDKELELWLVCSPKTT